MPLIKYNPACCLIRMHQSILLYLTLLSCATAALVPLPSSTNKITNWRVVDASNFPLLQLGHPQATIHAVADKIASAILQDLAMPAMRRSLTVVS